MMAQEYIAETLESLVVLNDQTNDGSAVDSVSLDPSISRNTSFSRLNAQAPEFVPRSSNRSDLQQPRLLISQGPRPIPIFQAPKSPFHVQVQNHGHYQNYGSFGDHEIVQTQAALDPDPDPVPVTKNGLSEEAAQKILNQVEYYFSDINLATTDHLMRFINKDPEGFVPISVVAAFRKIKSLISGHPQLAIVLGSSSKLVVSDDGKKVRRQQPLTESDMEDLQSRIVVAENLPEDHSYQNLMKVFSAIGGVKTIRTCQPQSSSVGASAASRSAKIDNMFFSNKLHAFVEYETVELAEKAVSELNDERNWRSGLRLRLLLKRSPKSEQARGRKSTHEGEGNSEENGVSTSEQPNDKVDDHSRPSDASSHDHTGDEVVHDKENMARKAKGRGRGRGRPRGQYHNNRGNHIGTPPSNIVQNEHSNVTKLPPGPRMPDGTRGFTMGRGKPIGI